MTNGYELVDSGDFEKLEKFGEFLLRRPDPQAIWKKSLNQEEWNMADAVFDKNLPAGNAGWHKNRELKENWIVEVGGTKFFVSLGSFKHVGLFPEHKENWEWLEKQVVSSKQLVVREEKIKILNLFGYTGGATLACAKAGAEVVHVDASKVSVEKAKENAANAKRK